MLSVRVVVVGGGGGGVGGVGVVVTLFTFEGKHWFHSNFAELYITIKYRSSLILLVILQILAELWSFFDLDFVVRFRSITFEGMHWFHSNFTELDITVKYSSSSILVIIRQILAELWPFFDLVLLVCWYWFPINNFCRDALILLKVCRRVYHFKIQVKFDISNHSQNCGQVMALFRLSFLLVCWYSFPLNNFCRDALILLKVCRRIYHCKIQVRFGIVNNPQNVGQVMALFRLTLCCWGKIHGKDIVSPQLFPLNNLWRYALISFEVCRMVYHYTIEVKFDFGNNPKKISVEL